MMWPLPGLGGGEGWGLGGQGVLRSHSPAPGAWFQATPSSLGVHEPEWSP